MLTTRDEHRTERIIEDSSVDKPTIVCSAMELEAEEEKEEKLENIKGKRKGRSGDPEVQGRERRGRARDEKWRDRQ